jgi:predicted transcriptional regulator
MTDPKDRLRDKDRVVLQAISNDQDDIQKITAATTLENHEVNYCFTKLKDLNLIQIEKPSGYTTRVINGQKRTFKTPKKAQITEKGGQALLKPSNSKEFKRLSDREISQKINSLENRMDSLESQFRTLKTQIQQMLK